MAIFHQLFYDEWVAGPLNRPLARIKVDEKNCFGMIEWKAVRQERRRRGFSLPAHGSSSVETSMLNKKGSRQRLRIVGADQGDVDGPWSAAWLQGWRRLKHESAWPRCRQATSHGLALMILQNHSDCMQTRVHETAKFQLGAPEKLTRADDPQHTLQKNGGLADLWHKDDGDIMHHPILVPSYLQKFDVANARVGVERNPQKTEVIYNMNNPDAAALERRVPEVPKSPQSQREARHSGGCRTATAHRGPAFG